MRVSRPDGELVAVLGRTRSGKTTWTAQQVAREKRLLVWDAAGEWHNHGCEIVVTPAALRERLLPPRLDRLAYRGEVSAAGFDLFCRLAWIWLRAARGALVVEELADVTHPGKAPLSWGEIIRKGLRYGPRIFALSQRPAEADKTALGNASRIHAHAMRTPADRRYVADLLGVEVLEVERLAPLEWIESDAAGRVSRGRVSFGRARRP